MRMLHAAYFSVSYENSGAHLEFEYGCSGETLSGKGTRWVIIHQVDPHSNTVLWPPADWV